MNVSEPFFIGREKAVQTLETALAYRQSVLVSVIGRRRVGKTYLIRHQLDGHIVFSISGLQHADLKTQLANFELQLTSHFGAPKKKREIKDWLSAFAALAQSVDVQSATSEKRPVIFFDELPWLATRRSKFLQAFSWFWNSWAAFRTTPVVVVICGSAASWMIKKVVRDKGGLHNRITHRIFLKPFTLYETALYLEKLRAVSDKYQQLLLYMALGGVPYYLEQVLPGESAIQAIQRLVFDENAPLRSEFQLLYASLFEHADRHIQLVRLLSAKHQGYTRKEIVAKSEVSNGGGLTRILEELTLSGFIESDIPFTSSSRATRYRLIDEYSAFYLKFVEPARQSRIDYINLSQQQSYRSWSGFAFERVCRKHTIQIQRALGLAGVFCKPYTYMHQGNDDAAGVQIDLLLDRADQSISLIETKFSSDSYQVTKDYANQLRQKKSRFRVHTKTKKHLWMVMLTTYGIEGGNAVGIVDTSLTMDVIFEPE